MLTAIAQWIRLRLRGFCGLGSNPSTTSLLSFNLNLNLNCNVKRTKINKKRLRCLKIKI